MSVVTTPKYRARRAAPADLATCVYYTGLDPMTKRPVEVANKLHDRKMQRALMQFFKPENDSLVREAIIKAGRQDLIGNGCDCFVPATPTKAAINARRRSANDLDHFHTVAIPAKERFSANDKLPARAVEPETAEGEKTKETQSTTGSNLTSRISRPVSFFLGIEPR